jgi:hypothetical protein
MPSATKKLSLIRARKDKPNKANRKADQKRIRENMKTLKESAAGEKG